MNKLFLVLLAVGIASAAIVKRDAEKPDENGIKKITDDLQKFGDTVAKGFKENFDMEKIQKQVNDGIKELQKNLENLIPKQETKA